MADIDTESLNLYIPLLDDRSEEQIYQAALNVVANRSGGKLNDFSDSNPLGVLLRSQAFAGAEILYRANKLPLALILKFLEITGVKRSLGRKASASITFNLTAARSTPFTIPLGFEVLDVSGKYSFTTDSLLTIPAGSSNGTVDASAVVEGADYNLPAYTITQFTQPLAFLASVVNTSPSQGGAGAESVESAINRGIKSLRLRNPVSADDFEVIAEEIMGDGSKSKAIGLLDGQKRFGIPGAIHLFCLSPTREPANSALINDVFAALSPKLMLGTSLYVSPMELLPVSGNIVAKLSPDADPTIVAEALWTEYQNFLSPSAYLPGATLINQELRHQIRFVSGVAFIDELTTNDSFVNIPMPNDWTLPTPYSLAMTLVDIEGNFFQTMRGAGETIDFEAP